MLKFAGPLRNNAGECLGEFINTAQFGLARPFDVRWCSHGLVVTTHMAQPAGNGKDHHAAVSLFDAKGLLVRSLTSERLQHPNCIVCRPC